MARNNCDSNRFPVGKVTVYFHHGVRLTRFVPMRSRPTCARPTSLPTATVTRRSESSATRVFALSLRPAA